MSYVKLRPLSPLKLTAMLWIVCLVGMYGFFDALSKETNCGQMETEISKFLQERGLDGCAFRIDINGLTLIATEEVGMNLSLLKGLPVRNLYVRDCGLTNLNGVECLDKLQVLDMSGNSIADISPLRKLQLVSLNLAGNPVKDLDPILQPHLRELFLSGTEINDIACLSNMPLTRIELGIGPKMKSFPIITNLPLNRLSFLQRPEMRLADIRTLKLESLTVFGVRQGDLFCLTNMPLKELELRIASINDLTALRFLRLRSLVVDSLDLTSLDGIESMPLEKLVISANKVKDLSSIARLPLKELEISCGATDLSPLKQLPLEKIILNKELAIKNIHVLEEIQTLKFIGQSSFGEMCDAKIFLKNKGTDF